MILQRTALFYPRLVLFAVLLLASTTSVHAFTATPMRRRCSSSSETSTCPIDSTTIFSRHFPTTRLWAAIDDDDDEDDDEDEDDETDDPLADGIDSVQWLASLDSMESSSSSSDTTTKDHPDAEVIPLFPLGGIVYTPNSEHILNIFEPRYRQMYSDILMNGSKRFAVSMSHPNENGRFAQMGVLFELEDLKEVSEKTGDQIKFICNHKVTGRVQMHRVLNPEVWSTRETYLRVAATIVDDSGKDGTTTEAEAPREQKLLRHSFAEMVDIQHQLSEDVRFTRESVASMGIKPGAGEDGLWQTIKLWQTFVDQRLMARQNELQRDFQEKLQDFLKKEKGLAQDEMPSAVGFQDLPTDLQKEVLELQKSMAIELQPLVLESQLTMQKVLECPDHVSRLKLVRTFIDAETKRLRTKKTLQGVFASPPATSLDITPEEEETKGATESSSSFFVDDGDAFQ